MKQNATNMIKGRFSNQVHAILEPQLGVKGSQRWKNQKQLSNAEKLELFEKISEAHQACSEELKTYQLKRRSKKAIQRARAERGYIPKKKTSLTAWLKMQESGEFLNA